MNISIVIPAFNEERRLPSTLWSWLTFLTVQSFTWEILVVDDGSHDRTAAVAEEVAAIHPAVRVLRQPHNRGKGAAVRAGMLAAAGAHIFSVDADLNVAPENVIRFLAALRSGCDVAIGTRSARQYAATERNPSRVAAGVLIQLLRRTLLLPTLRDTQCGFKGYNRAAARAIFSRTTVDGFAFDIEALFLARKLGYRITEIPVSVAFRPGSTYSLRRHLVPFLADIIRVKRQEMRGMYRVSRTL